MKLDINTYSNNKVESTGGITKTVKFGMAKEAQKMVFGIFTKSLYSNPIGSIVREIGSNCFDSHHEAGVDEPVKIKFTIENNQYYINFTDVGVGMSYERVTTIFAEYFNSTKREDEGAIGGYGIGGKTPLAYSDSFYLDTVFNGKHFIWCVYKGEESPMLDLMLEESTDQCNGTTVRIPIKTGDYSKFEYEMLRQLYYFENIIFEGFSPYISNDYTIYRAKHFLYRGDDYASRIHICLGRVAYPIDYSALGLVESEYNVPIALKFNINDIEVTPSRETIQYTEETIKAIKKKLESAKAEMRDMLLKQYQNISSLEEYYQIKAEYGNLILDAEKNIKIKLERSMANEEELIYQKYSTLRLPDVETLTKLFVKIDIVGRKKATKKEDEETIWNGSVLSATTHTDIYFIEEGEKKNKRTQSWLKMSHPLRYFFVTTHKHLTENNIALYEEAVVSQDYRDLTKTMHRDAHNLLIDVKTKLLPLKGNATSVFFSQVRQLRDEVLTLMRTNSAAYNAISVPDEYVIFRKNEFSKAMLDRKVTAMSVRGSYGNKRKETTFRELIDFKGIIIYGVHGEDSQVKSAFDALYHLGMLKNNSKVELFKSESNIHAITFNKTTVELLKHVKSAVHYNDVYPRFVIKKREVIKRICESKAFMNRYNNINDLYFNKALTSIDKKLKAHGDKLTVISKTFKNLSEKSTSVFDLRKLKIDEAKFKSGFDKHFEYIEAQTKKNEMIKYVNIPRWDDATKNKDLMQLIDLVYVK